MAERSQGSRKASQNIRNGRRPCRDCGEPIAIVHAHDVQTKLHRVLVVEPEPDSAGWFVIVDSGAYMDSDYTIKGGTRYRRHECPGRAVKAS